MRRLRHPDEPMWVIGCIDAYGAIRARVAAGHQNKLHGKEESVGKRWRWNIWGQEFYATREPLLNQLSDEEIVLVESWLEHHGHKEFKKLRRKAVKL